MNEYAAMMEVKEIKVANLLVENVLTLEFGQSSDSLMSMVEEANHEQKCVLELTIDEWSTLNLVAWHVYQKLIDRMEATRSLLEKSAIEKFMDSYESAVQKLNDCEIGM